MRATESSVSFDGPGRPLVLDIFRPATATPRAAVLLVHGGGWARGNRSTMTNHARCLAALGYVAIATEYRLLGEAPWPAQLEDVSAALNWVANNCSSLGVDANHIVLQGFSAGAHIALLAASASGQCAAVAAFFPTVELVMGEPVPGQERAQKLLGPDATADAAHAASPLHAIRSGFPPTILFHGTNDWMVSHEASVNLLNVLRKHAVPADLHLFAELTHEYSLAPSMLELSQTLFANFVDRFVSRREEMRAEEAKYVPFVGGPAAFAKRMAAQAAKR